MSERENTIANTDKSRMKAAFWVTYACMGANIVLMIFKFIAGFVAHSGAMIADAVHSLSDFASDIVVIVGIRIASEPEDETHNYGHGKFETLSTLIIGVVLFTAGMGILYKAFEHIFNDIMGINHPSPGKLAFWAAVVSIVVKEILYQWTYAAGKKLKSAVMIANAWHHRTDALSSIGAALGIGASVFLGEAWGILDSVSAVAIGALILKVSYDLSSSSVRELLEQSLNDSQEKEIFGVISGVVGVSDVHNMKTRMIGSNIAVDVHIRVNRTLNIVDAHNIASDVEQTLKKRFENRIFVSVHMEPEHE